MGQFKPMVKMETTEPSVILKLAKGGYVNMKKGGKAESGHKKMASGGMGALSMMSDTPALVGRPAVNAPVRAPGRPSMSMRRKAMMAKAPAVMPSMPPMKKGGKAEGGKMDESQDKAMIKKAFKQHDTQEHKGGKGTKLALKKGGKMATGGVVKGQGGYKKGGKIKKMAEGGGLLGVLGVDDPIAGEPPGIRTPSYGGGGGGGDAGAGLGQVNLGAGTIGRALSTAAQAIGGGGGQNPGLPPSSALGSGMKKGGSAKKAYATGGSVNSGRPVAMPQGAKKPSSPVSINQLSGTFKKGGKVKRMNDGGDAQSKKETKGYKGTYATQEAENIADREAMNPFNIVKDLYGKARDAVRGQGSVSDKEHSIFSDIEKGLPSPAKGQGSVTKTERSVTVSPAGKKRGGMANC